MATLGHRWLRLIALGAFAFAADRLAAQSIYELYHFELFAGDLASGDTDGATNVARFRAPTGVTLDQAQNLFIADSLNDSIRKITPTGTVTTVAGLTGSPGGTDGTGTAARFRRPLGIAADADGNVYVADTDNCTIRKVTPAGVVTTLAGEAQMRGDSDGVGTSARFAFPVGVAVDSANNVYVSDYGNHTIRRITPAGVVSTLAGLAGTSGAADGVGPSARFNHPWGITVGVDDSIFVADYENCTIRRITSAGAVTTIAGTPGVVGNADGQASAATFGLPTSLARDGAGNLFICDTVNQVVRKISTGGAVTTLAGTTGTAGFANGTGRNVRFNNPQGIVVDPIGTVYIGDYSNNSIRIGAPADLSLRITSIIRSATGVLLSGIAAPGQTVEIEASPSLVQPFVTIGTTQGDLAGMFVFEDTNPGASGRRFYRAR